jgi:hypothetical protein
VTAATAEQQARIATLAAAVRTTRKPAPRPSAWTPEQQHRHRLDLQYASTAPNGTSPSRDDPERPTDDLPQLQTPEEKLTDAKERLAIPKIVCLCGSTRFMTEMGEADLQLTADGHIVVMPGCDMKSPHPAGRTRSRPRS